MLLLLHGALYTAAEFAPLIDALGPDRQVHTFDFPGHGSRADQKGPFGIGAFADATLEEMDRLGVAQADIFGFSMGGYVALYLAATHPERVGRITTLGTKMAWDEETAEREMKNLDPETIEKKVPAFAEVLRDRHGDPAWKTVLERTAAMMSRLGAEPPLTDETLASIEHPVRMMVGDRDRMVSIEETQAAYRALANGELMVVPGTPHGVEVHEFVVRSL